MLVLRGRADTPNEDRGVTDDLLSHTAATGQYGLRVWRPHQQVAFGRRDTHATGYDTAANLARDHGYEPMVRRVGGRAVAYTGRTAAFVRTEPVTDIRSGLDERYESVTTAVQRACWRLGAPVQRGEPPDSFCPGSHSLSGNGKLAGVAQRVTGDAALVAGVLLIDDQAAFASIIGEVYDALEIPFDPTTVGSLAGSGGRSAWPTVRAELEDALAEGRERAIRPADGQPFERS